MNGFRTSGAFFLIQILMKKITIITVVAIFLTAGSICLLRTSQKHIADHDLFTEEDAQEAINWLNERRLNLQQKYKK